VDRDIPAVEIVVVVVVVVEMDMNEEVEDAP
jgi:hypothetical protein